ncbi:MAG: hypothetical protein D6820_09050, partial [Lentisphaerae bacterium]
LETANKEAIESFREIARSLNELIDLVNADKLELQLIFDGIQTIRGLAADYKFKRGLLSYDDMLLHIYQSLNRKDAAEDDSLAQALSNTFQYGLVDEFQDTDPIQWGIFRQIFLQPNTSSKLYVIGDPKQAIYSFRGADVWTYFKACREMREHHQAAEYYLSTNWRSTPSMIKGFNLIFTADVWFGAAEKDGEMNYKSVSACSSDKQRFKDLTLPPQRNTINCVDLDVTPCNGTEARERMATFIANEICWLMQQPISWIDQNGEKHQLQLGDIAILFRKGVETQPLEKALQQANIPYSYYKKDGVYQSIESQIVLHLFLAIAQPQNRGRLATTLIGPFFAYRPEMIYQVDLLQSSHPVKNTFFYWNELAKNKMWGALYQSILRHTRLAWDGDWDETRFSRRLIHQILNDIICIAQDRALSIDQLCELLYDFDRFRSSLPEDANLYQSILSSNRVQLMTMHASKGLEFPIVFIAGGFTEDRSNSFCQIYHDSEGRRVFDLQGGPVPQATEEERSERLRLFYVALTRAIGMLYLPQYAGNQQSSGYGASQPSTAPVCDFLTPAVRKKFENNKLPVATRHPWRLHGPAISSTLPSPEKRHHEQTGPEIDLIQEIIQTGRLPWEVTHTPPWLNRGDWIESFSSLQRRLEEDEADHAPVPENINLFAGAGLDEPTSNDLFLSDDEPTTSEELILLPPGSHTGTIIHELLEKLDYQAVSTDPQSLIDSSHPNATLLRQTAIQIDPTAEPSLIQRRCEFLAQMIASLFHQPLDGDQLTLHRIQPNHRVHELEFCMHLPPLPDVPELQQTDGFLVGFIDLVFQYHDKFYILDWKTNYLEDGYDHDSLAQCMDKHYTLQYRIYTLALMRWLTHTHNITDAHARIGGIYYIFLRGINSPAPTHGIYHHAFTDPNQLKQLEHELIREVTHVR